MDNFQVDVGTVQEATAFMKSPRFAASPAGVMYDPDALLSRLEAGEPENKLLMRPSGPPSDIPVAHGLT